MVTLIKTYANPDSRKKWIISVELDSAPAILLRYIPDRLVADHTSARKYLKSQLDDDWSTPEEMVLKMIEDIHNELVPKWLEVEYSHHGVVVKIEDKQPGS